MARNNVQRYDDITPDTDSKTIQVQLCVLVDVMFVTMFNPSEAIRPWHSDGRRQASSKNGQTQSFPPLQGTKELLLGKGQHLGGFHVHLLSFVEIDELHLLLEGDY